MNILESIGDISRAFVCEEPGFELIAGDFSLFEASYLATIAGETWKIEACAKYFRTCAEADDPYLQMGKWFNVDDAEARAVGKALELAHGFGGGHRSFFTRNPDSSLSEEEAKQRCHIWRLKHPKIVQFRHSLEQAAVAAVREPDVPQHFVRHKLYCRKIGNLNFLSIELPSGRSISYPDAHLVDDEWNGKRFQAIAFMDNSGGRWQPYEGPTGKPYAWNGLFVENVVQAGTRDIVAAAMCRLEAAGYEVVLTVHDEILCRVRENEGSLQEFKYLLEMPPEWAKALGLPIGAKVWRRQRWAEGVNIPIKHVPGAITTPDQLAKPQKVKIPEHLQPPKPARAVADGPPVNVFKIESGIPIPKTKRSRAKKQAPVLVPAEPAPPEQPPIDDLPAFILADLEAARTAKKPAPDPTPTQVPGWNLPPAPEGSFFNLNFIDGDKAERVREPRCVRAALAYADKGWATFPAPRETKKSHKSAKYSRGVNWGATKNPAALRRDFEKWFDANVGIPTGPENGIFVVEIDTKEGGHREDGAAGWQALINEHGPLPETLTAESPSGSTHYYFRWPADQNIKNSASTIAPGIDVRGDGGMVIAPPSVKGKGAYRWITNVAPVKAPAWLLELIATAGAAEGEEHAPGIPEAELNEIEAALAAIPNDDAPWESDEGVSWNVIGMAVYAASGGSDEGLELFKAWSQKSTTKYNEENTEKKWQLLHGCPPTQIGFGSLAHWASQADPDWRAKGAYEREREDPPLDDNGHAGGREPPPPGGGNGGGALPPPPQGSQEKAGPPRPPKFGFELVRAIDVKERAVVWFWPGHIARGELEILTGVPDIGKSQVHCSYISHMTTGRDWPDGEKGPPVSDVVMLTAEDNTAHTIKPRLIAAGADLSRVHFLHRIRKDKRNRMFVLQEDLDVLEFILQMNSNIGLVTVDPITAYLGGKLDSHRATDVRNQLGPLKDFAERYNVAISAITHPAKRPGEKALNHYIGSQAFIAAPRIGHICVWEMADDGQGKQQPTGRALFANPKHNIYKAMPTLAYELIPAEGGSDSTTNEPIQVTRVRWAEEVGISADQALATAEGNTTKATSGITTFLLDVLTNGPVLKTKLDGRAAERGFSSDQLKRAKAKMAGRVVAWQKPNEKHSGWYWSLLEHRPGEQSTTDNKEDE